MKILVTGAAGFVGSVCARMLVARGHDVVTTDRRGPVDKVGDLADGAFTAALPSADAVVHAAAVQYVSSDLPLLNRRTYFHENNVVATARLCERFAIEPTHFVNIGTSMMYEQNGSPEYRVTMPLKGQGVYSASKLEALQYVLTMPKAATVIPCIIGGVGREGLFRSFVSSMKRRGIVVFPGKGDHPTSMVHVDDVATLITAIVETSAVGLFNAAGPAPLSIHQWVDEIESELGLSPVKRITPPLSPIALASAATGYRLLAREQLLMLAQPHALSIAESLALGWRPQFTNAQIVRTIARYITST